MAARHVHPVAGAGTPAGGTVPIAHQGPILTVSPAASGQPALGTRPAIDRDPDDVVRITGYDEARTILGGPVVQAGFKAELVLRMPSQMVPPVLYQDGEGHRDQRRQSARFFSPAVTDERHRPVMERYADEIVADFERAGMADVGALATRMAVSVVGDVVGLSNSPRDGMAQRLGRILEADLELGRSPRQLFNYVRMQFHVLRFYLHDVRPAIRARQREPLADVISHLLSLGRRGPEILAECIAYGAAGMVTTREFIAVVVWHCLRSPDLAAVMRGDDREERYRLLHELLRLEPVVTRLYRRVIAAQPIPIDSGTMDLAADDLVELDLVAINGDSRAAGEEPWRIDHDREMPRGVPRSVLGFGAGPHRCAGEFIALAETDAFVRRILRAPNLRIERAPTIGRNETVKSYAVRGFIVRCDPRAAG
ncbi:MAG: cytochrome P450 [Candidatus Limnocylindrales bacterium]